MIVSIPIKNATPIIGDVVINSNKCQGIINSIIGDTINVRYTSKSSIYKYVKDHHNEYECGAYNVNTGKYVGTKYDDLEYYDLLFINKDINVGDKLSTIDGYKVEILKIYDETKILYKIKNITNSIDNCSKPIKKYDDLNILDCDNNFSDYDIDLKSII